MQFTVNKQNIYRYATQIFSKAINSV